MDVEEILRRAWDAVQKSGIPEPIQEAAFKKAVDILRTGESESPSHTGNGRSGSGAKTKLRKKPPKGASSNATNAVDVNEDTFFADLAQESGVAEEDLRDVLQLTPEGEVQVMQPTKDLGSATANQARTVVALVGGARSHGLGEKPVKLDPVREEVERKRCYQQNNFAHGHIGRMKGFNIGSKGELLLNSKWVDEFKAAVDQALGRKPAVNKD